MAKITIGGIIKTSVVTGFTIATALIWKEVVIDAIHAFFPPQDVLLYEFLVAIIATVLIVLFIYLVLKAEDETEIVIKRLRKSNKRKKKK